MKGFLIGLASGILMTCAVGFAIWEDSPLQKGGLAQEASQTTATSSTSPKQAKLNDNPASYIKSVTAYKEGIDGHIVYFILADANGAMTTSEGTVSVKIVNVAGVRPGTTMADILTLYSLSFPVTKADFRRTKVGVGAFEQEVIVLSLGRFAYSEYLRQPYQRAGTVVVDFTTADGRTLGGAAAISF